MVRVMSRVGVVATALAALTTSSAVASAATASPSASAMSLELHRLPSAVVSRHAASQRQRRLKTEGDGFETVPLNLGMGTHYTWVYAGTPPQRASVITDTGSSIMAFPCAGCDNCGKHTDQPFVATNSSTLTHVTCSDPSFFRCQGCGAPDSSKKTCEISQSYMEGSSWHASVVEDIVYLGGDDSFRDAAMRNTFGTHFRFGCQKSETGLFISQVADGIMGLANNDNHIVAKLYKEKKIPNKLFSLCFAAEGGAMSIGAPDTSRHKGNISYAKLVRTASHDFYGVELRDVRVAGTPVEASKTTYTFGKYIVDSGTTDSYLPSSMKQAFQEAFKKASGLEYHVSSSACTGYTDEQLDKLPNIEFILGAEDGGNLTIVVTPDQYLLQEATGKYCSSIFLSESSGGVIGANIMMDHDVIFDQGNQRVGFVEADCDFRRLPASELPAGNATSSPAPPSDSSATPAAAIEHVVTTSPPPVVTEEAVTTTPVPTETQTPKPASTVATEAPTEKPTTTPVTSEATEDDDTASVGDETPTPTSSSVSNATGKLTATPSATTETPTPEPTHTSAAPTIEVPATTLVSTSAPTTEEPAANLGVKTASDTSNEVEEEQRPIVLTIVGTVLVVAFILVAVLSARRRKRAKRDRQYGRVKETEGDVDEDDDDEEELIVHTPGQRKAKKQKPFRDVEGNDDDDEDEKDDEVSAHRGGPVGGRDDDDDDGDDDIFDRDVDDHDHRKHDARMLEQL